MPDACQQKFCGSLGFLSASVGGAGSCFERARLVAKLHFAAADQLIVNPQAVLVGAGFGAGAWRAGLQAHARGSLENIRGERATVHVEFDAQIAGVADPGDLISGIENYNFWKYTNENGTFGHVQVYS